MAISNYTATTNSGEVVGANFGRIYLIITNTGSVGVFLNIGGAAEVNKGLYLVPSGGVWIMDVNSFSQENITAITASSTTNLAIYQI
jgi:hypothetical protein